MARPRKSAPSAPLWKTALYLRLSREDGGDESYSITQQKQRLTAFFERFSAEERAELAGVFIDDGRTGTDSDRDGLRRLLCDIEAGNVNCVAVKDLSRLSRNDWECKRYLQHFFVVKNVRFISLELPALDSGKNPDGVYDLGLSIQSIYNENHCRETSVKVRGTLDAKRARGEFIGAFAPYGYAKDKADKHRLVLDSEAAAVVSEIFRMFARGGLSAAGIAKRLNSLGIPSPAQYKKLQSPSYFSTAQSNGWSARTVTAILKNRMYTGDMVQGRQRVKSYKVHTRASVPESEWFVVTGTHEPAVDAQTFALAQSLLRRDTRTAPGSAKIYPFSGFVRCADCGGAMCRRTSKGYVYYACKSHAERGICSRHGIRHEALEREVLRTIRERLAQPDAPRPAAPAVTARRPVEPLLSRREREAENARKLRAGLYEDWKNGDLTREEYLELKERLALRELNAMREIGALEREAESEPPRDCLSALLAGESVSALDRAAVTALVKQIRVHEGGAVSVVLCF